MTLILSGTDGLSDVDGSAATPAIRGTDTNTGIFFPAADTIAFSEGGVESMRIDSLGNVGIGITSPLQRFNAVNTSITGGAPASSGSSADPNAVARFQAGSVVMDFGVYSAGQMWIQNRSFTNYAVNYDLVLNPNGGNVGIGTSSPTSSGAGYTVLHINNATNGGQLHLTGGGSGAATADGTIITHVATELYINNQEAGPTNFYNNGAERMRIDSSGNLLLATTTASGKIATFVGPGQVGYYTNKSSGGGGLDHAQYYTDGGLQGKITQTGGFTTVSDYRIKSAVVPLTGMLEKVCKLKPVSYTLTAFNQQQFGFIAHELQEELPVFVDGEKDAVNEDGSIAPQSVDYPKIVSVLTAAIQEQQAIITQLQADVATLKGTS